MKGVVGRRIEPRNVEQNTKTNLTTLAQKQIRQLD